MGAVGSGGKCCRFSRCAVGAAGSEGRIAAVGAVVGAVGSGGRMRAHSSKLAPKELGASFWRKATPHW